ncbi:MAG: hypothetical protein QOE54_5557 [Streptosporangiaceae bacterium]|jgi:hypothetical protein|nr:hypothetical protein [Streptosporangiaceae bacterium]
MRATYHRNDGVRHLLAGYNLTEDRLYGHVKTRKKRVQFLEFCRYLRSLHPQDVRIAIICDNFSPHLTTKKDTRVGDWAQANNVEIAYTPTNSSWLNPILSLRHPERAGQGAGMTVFVSAPAVGGRVSRG